MSYAFSVAQTLLCTPLQGRSALSVRASAYVRIGEFPIEPKMNAA